MITVDDSGADLIIDFADNGQGIAADAQDVIFEKFFRVTGVDGEGAGLGLSICREIMTRLGGDVRYVSAQGGAVFRVSLPKRAVQHPALKEPALSEVI